jgi:hypothetical protein
MAYPTAVNNQITDAVTQSNVKALAEAPALAMANLYQAIAQSLALAAQNAAAAQQLANTFNEAVTARCANLLTNGD